MEPEELVKKMDEILEEGLERINYFSEEITPGKARMFVLQHRLNSRYRNSTLKLRVATNCTVWEIKINILEACSEEILGDYKYFDGKPHWKMLEELGLQLGLKKEQIQSERPLRTTRAAWFMYEGLMSNTHWLLGLLGNTCMERAFIPNHGRKILLNKGVALFEYERWMQALKLKPDQLTFFYIHSKADVEHSENGWKNIAKYAKRFGLEEEILRHLEMNMFAWKTYYDGVNEAGKKLDNGSIPDYSYEA